MVSSVMSVGTPEAFLGQAIQSNHYVGPASHGRTELHTIGDRLQQLSKVIGLAARLDNPHTDLPHNHRVPLLWEVRDNGPEMRICSPNWNDPLRQTHVQAVSAGQAPVPKGAAL